MTVSVLALISAAGLIGSVLQLWRRWTVPTVAVELLAGFLLGASAFRLVDPTQTALDFLANQVGFALVMFVVGTHVPLRLPAFRQGLKKGFSAAVAVGIVSVPVGWSISELFGTDHAMLYAVLVASSSAAVIMPMLDRATSESAQGVGLIAQVAIADIACIVALPLAIEPNQALRRLLGMTLVALASGALFVVLRWLEKRQLRQRAHTISTRRQLALELRVSLTVLFAIVSLGEIGGVSPMFAGFGTGLAVAAVGEPHRLAKQLFAVTEGFFSPIFFICLGAAVDIRAVAANPSMAILGMTLAIAAIIAHLAAMPFGRPLQHAVISSAQLGIPASAVAMGTSSGLLHDGESAAILISALITIAFASAARSVRKTALKPLSTGDEHREVEK